MRKTGDMSKKRIKAEVKKCHIVEKVENSEGYESLCFCLEKSTKTSKRPHGTIVFSLPHGTIVSSLSPLQM